MDKLKYLLLLLTLLAGCEKKNQLSSDQTWDGKNHVTENCHYSPVLHTGLLTNTTIQYVQTNTNVIDYPLDSIAISLCKSDNTCKSMPSVYIAIERNKVVFTHAFEAGYETYNINEAVCAP